MCSGEQVNEAFDESSHSSLELRDSDKVVEVEESDSRKPSLDVSLRLFSVKLSEDYTGSKSNFLATFVETRAAKRRNELRMIISVIACIYLPLVVLLGVLVHKKEPMGVLIVIALMLGIYVVGVFIAIHSALRKLKYEDDLGDFYDIEAVAV